VLLIQTLLNGLSLLRLRQEAPRPEHSSPSALVLAVFGLLIAQGCLSYLTNGHPGHIEWLALPDLTFPMVLLAFSCWAVSVLVHQKEAVLVLLNAILSARIWVVLIQITLQALQHKLGGLEGWEALPDVTQELTELWWLLAVMVRLGQLSKYLPVRDVTRPLWVWGAFIGPWMFWLTLFQPADLWQADGTESDPKHFAQAMSEDSFTAEALMFDGMLDNFEAERPGEEDIYYLGVAGEAGNSLYLREAELALESLRDVYGMDGRAGILANNANNTARYPFATHNNLEATLDRIGELIDADEDILFLFLSSRGTQTSSIVLSQPGLMLADINPKGLKKALDDAKIKWRIIVISACYSGAFINELSDAKTLVVTSSDNTDKGLGCAANKGTTWFTQFFFETYLKQSLGMTAAFTATVDALAKQQGSAEHSGLPQISMGAQMKHKLAGLESRVLQPGALKDGIRAQWGFPNVSRSYAGMSGVREHSKAWMASFKRSLRFFKRTKANSSISEATM